MFVGNLEAKLIPYVFGRLCKDSIKGGHWVEFAYPLPAPSVAVVLAAGPLGRVCQGKKKGADIVEETGKSIQGVARVEKKIKGISGP